MNILYISLGILGVTTCAVMWYAAWRLYKWVNDEDDDEYEDDDGYEDEEDPE